MQTYYFGSIKQNAENQYVCVNKSELLIISKLRQNID
mgnify:CR=1 FL=1